jgi:6-phosphogluconolactonase
MPNKLQIQFFVFPNAAALADAAARYFITRIPEAGAKTVSRIAISGGSTPKAMFHNLGSEAYEKYAERWKNLQLYWVDERCVPPDDAESNYRMTEETLLAWVPLPPENVHRMEGELEPAVAAARYEAVLCENFGLKGYEPPRGTRPYDLPGFDLIFLGMGTDGHTASLFPHTEAIDAMGALVVANEVPQKVTWRITLTWPVINHAKEVVFLIEGADKAEILYEVVFGPRDPDRLPSQLIRPASGKLVFLLDEAAAAKIPREGAQQHGAIWSNVVEV